MENFLYVIFKDYLILNYVFYYKYSIINIIWLFPNDYYENNI